MGLYYLDHNERACAEAALAASPCGCCGSTDIGSRSSLTAECVVCGALASISRGRWEWKMTEATRARPALEDRMTKPTPGARKAAELIMMDDEWIFTSRGRKRVEGLAEMIDDLTGAPALLEVMTLIEPLVEAVCTSESGADLEDFVVNNTEEFSDALARLRAAITQARGDTCHGTGVA